MIHSASQQSHNSEEDLFKWIFEIWDGRTYRRAICVNIVIIIVSSCVQPSGSTSNHLYSKFTKEFGLHYNYNYAEFVNRIYNC